MGRGLGIGVAASCALGLMTASAGWAASGDQAAGDQTSCIAAIDRSTRLAREGSSVDWNACSCLHDLMRRDHASSQPFDAAARLEALLEAPPPLDGCAAFYLAQIRERAGEPAQPLYERAARAFAASERYQGVFWARINLARLARQAERWPRAVAELDGSLEAARLTGDREQILQAELERLRLRVRAGDDFRQIESELSALLDDLTTDPLESDRITPRILTALGDVRFRLGRFRGARQAWSELEILYREAGRDFARANVVFNLALEHLSAEAMDPAAAQAALRRAIEVARSAGHRGVEASASGLLAQLVDDPEERDALFARGLELADAASKPVQRRDILAALATEQAARAHGGAAARRALDDALALVDPSLDGTRDPVASSAYLWEARMRVAWAMQPADEALETSSAVLDDLERLRARQLARGGRGDYFSRWNVANDWLAGLLFERASGARVETASGDADLARLDREDAPSRIERRPITDPEALAEAVAVLERRRARLLLDTAALGDAATGDERAALDRLGDRMAALHRRLLTEDLAPAERDRIEASLDALESEEDAVWRRLESERARARRDAETTTPPRVELDALRRALSPDEALLITQSARSRSIFGHFAGGSWMVVATRDDLALYRLPDPYRLDLAIGVFAGLLDADAERSDAHSVGLAADALWRLAVAPAVEALPDAIEHLILLADGPLHRLPITAIGPTADSLVGLRYAVSRPPSASLWLRWRTDGSTPLEAAAAPRPRRRPALVFADPALGLGEGSVAETRSVDGLELGRLPGAAAEARAVRRRLGRATQVLVGAEAREASLEHLDPRRFAALHFAAHALVDPRRERRSGVVLAPSGTDDGLLRPPEIARLPLADPLVVLSACHGAAGRSLRGEGPLSLARAFFEAGARAVVAGLWRLRDDEAERFADAFYAALAGGASVADAARTARRSMHDAGRPASAWAPLVVLGDGELIPFPAGDEDAAGRRALWIALLIGLSTAAALFAVASARRRDL